MKNLLKTLITTILVAAIIVTGISIDTNTVTAATTNGTFKNGSTVTIKLRNSKKLLVLDSDGEDIASKYQWSSSDTNVVAVERDLYNDEDYTECVLLTAVGTGTATITGKGLGPRPNVTMTVKVTLPAPTAKQKKCKHVYKTTKAATCKRGGIKTCKKCKYQKEIKKVDHKYVTKTVYETEYDYYTETIYCHGATANEVLCPDGFKVIMKYDNEGNVAPDSDYLTPFDAVAALDKHMRETGHGTCGGTLGYKPCGAGHEVAKTKKLCKWCDKPEVPEKSLQDKIKEKHPEWYE